jgi:hypothetical protein
VSDTPPPPPDGDAELQREILAGRKFTVTEAIGRMAGGLMKGDSPVTGKRQAELTVQEYLARHLTDEGGVLAGVLTRRVSDCDLMLADFAHPLAVLAGYLRRVLGSDYLLKDVVRDADVEWGRVFGERPHFERDGCPPDPDDPYTHDSVRAALARLLEQAAADGGSAPA